MKHNNTFGVDLAKRLIQISEINSQNQVKQNKSLSPEAFKTLLATRAPSRFVFEACASAHYWARLARSHHHDAIILSAKFVAGSRQGQKTDKNDALACAVASRHPDARAIHIKTEDQQGLQAIERVQQALTKQSTAMNNMIIGLLFEFGIKLAKRTGEVSRQLPHLLEDAENGLPMCLRETLASCYSHYLAIRQRLADIERVLEQRVKQDEACRSLLALEGVGPINALGLYLSIGDGSGFKNGRAAAACIGVTPKQHSTGGKVNIGTVGKHTGNKRLRYTLFQGAMAVLQQLNKRPPRTEKEKWFLALVERRGARCAAMAYANKTVRTAWALLKHRSTYNAMPLATSS